MNDGVRKLRHEGRRVETGSVQFGEDWPGVFIRGDEAGYYALQLYDVLTDADNPLAKMVLVGLYDKLRGCIITSARDSFPDIPVQGLRTGSEK